MADYKDYYKILGVSKTANEAEIKKAFKTAARKYHPDLHPESEKAKMTEKFKDVNEAYEVLSDKQKRTVYDQVGPGFQNSGTSAGAGRGSSYSYDGGNPYGQYYDGQGFSGSGGGFNFKNTGGFSAGDFSDFFQNIFGGMGGGFTGANFGGMTGQEQDEEAGLTISLEDAHRGGKMKLTLPNGKTATVNIPAGISDGQKLRLRGMGSATRGGAKDLYLKIQLAPHPRFTHNGRDLHTIIHLMPWTAALGGEVSIPTLDSNIKIKVPAGTQTEKRMKLSGKGLGGKGDLYIKFMIDIPKTLTDKQKALFEKLRDL